MKKMICLLLAAMMILGTGLALADGSKTNEDIAKTTVVTTNATKTTYAYQPVPQLKIVANNDASSAIIKKFQDAYGQGDVLAALPDNIKSQLISGATKIDEMVTAQFTGDAASISSNVVVNVKFEVLYKPALGKVSILVGKLGEEGVTWFVLKGSIRGDGSIDITFPREVLKQLKNDPFVLAVVSK